MRILVDMDAVIADWGTEFDRMLDEEYRHESANIPRSREQQHWDLNRGRTEREKVIIQQIMTAPGFYSRLTLMPGAREVLKHRVAMGDDVRIVSSPYISNPTCASDKMQWIVQHYGSRWGSRLVLTNDKTIVRGGVLIDDKPEITGSMEPDWMHVVFGDYAYNRHVAAPRLTEWTNESFNEMLTQVILAGTENE